MKALYDSPWHHPFIAYLGAALLLFALVRGLPFLYGFLTLFLVTILADATVTGGWSPVPMGTGTYTFFSVLFIILGDLRYFLLAERVTRPRDSLARTLLFSVPVSFVMPVATGIMSRTIPWMADDRVLYAVYELAMCALVITLDRTRFGGRQVDSSIHRWVHEVSLFFAALYFGWGACDLLILAGVELGHVLRIIPNVMYYALFLPVVFFRAPSFLRNAALRGRDPSTY
jgi:hypothetical protein